MLGWDAGTAYGERAWQCMLGRLVSIRRPDFPRRPSPQGERGPQHQRQPVLHHNGKLAGGSACLGHGEAASHGALYRLSSARPLSGPACPPCDHAGRHAVAERQARGVRPCAGGHGCGVQGEAVLVASYSANMMGGLLQRPSRAAAALQGIVCAAHACACMALTAIWPPQIENLPTDRSGRWAGRAGSGASRAMLGLHVTRAACSPFTGPVRRWSFPTAVFWRDRVSFRPRACGMGRQEEAGGLRLEVCGLHVQMENHHVMFCSHLASLAAGVRDTWAMFCSRLARWRHTYE
jgi:hypothetical protein